MGDFLRGLARAYGTGLGSRRQSSNRAGSVVAELSTEHRNSLSSEVFGLSKERKYPMPDKSHAANAKARATQQEEKGNLSASQAEIIRAKANRVLDR
jgi:hypothetical protein